MQVYRRIVMPLLRPLSLFAALSGCLLLLGSAHDAAPKPKVTKPAYTVDDIDRRVTAALEWLVDHQGPQGQWSLKDFSGHSTRVRANKTHNLKWNKPGQADGDAAKTENRDVAGTALGLLCFSGSGHDHGQGKYKEFVAKAVQYLSKTQDSSGCFGQAGDACMVHDSAVATMALAELFASSSDETLKPALTKGVAFLLASQLDDGGWDCLQSEYSDTQMTSWCLLALDTAKRAGIEAEYDKAWIGAARWFEKMTVEVSGVPRTGYNAPGSGSPRNQEARGWAATPDMDAVHVLCRLRSGDKKWDTKSKELKKQADVFLANPPVWQEKKVDVAYAYFATLALREYGGKDWDKWMDVLLPVLMENQRGWLPEDKDSFEAVLDEFGSWDAVDAWHSVGGRVWCTFAATRMLQAIADHKRPKK